MKQDFWEAINSTTSQENPHIICNPKVHYQVQISPPLIPILNQVNPIYTLRSYFFKICINIILPYEHQGFQVVSFFQVSPSKPCIGFARF